MNSQHGTTRKKGDEIEIMNKPQYTNKPKKLATVQMMQEEYKYGKNLIYQIAKEANAIIRVGRTTRIDVEKFDKVLAEKYTV